MRKARLWAGILLGVAAATAPLALLSGPAAASTTPGPNTPEQVASGINVAALPGVTVFPGVPAGTPETVSFILREQNLPQLESQVEAGVRNYLSVSQFASIYGQTPANISALTGYLASFGITSDVYADDVDVSTTGTAGEYDQALSVTQNFYQVPQQPGGGGLGPIPAQTVHGNAQSPLLPYRLANFVLAILGLDNYGPYASQAMPPNTSLAQPQPGSSNSCIALTGLASDCNLPQDFAANYDLDGLYQRGADEAGQTLGIIGLGALDPGPAGYQWAPQYFWANVAHIHQTGTLTVQNIDGGPGAPSYSNNALESDIDVEQAGGVAPAANVIVYQAVPTDAGFADAFFTAASQNTASTVSVSYALSETALEAEILSGQEAPAYQQAFDEAFLELAAQGQSAFAASGDTGAYGPWRDIGTTNLSADTPPDSPYITAAGGTTLPWTYTNTYADVTITVPTQRIWGWDYLWQPIAQITGEPESVIAEEDVVGSGGGFSQIESTPSYQQGVPGTHNFHAVQYLTPTDYQTVAPGLVEPTAWSFNPTPSVTTGFGSGRAVPDVSTDADPETGYLAYVPSFAGIGEPVLQPYGGTSFVAPQLNGSTAVIDSYLGHRVGFWNPTIYAAALGGNSPFTPLDQAGTSNDNIYYTGNPGQPYNEGAGLGYPNLTELAGDFRY